MTQAGSSINETVAAQAPAFYRTKLGDAPMTILSDGPLPMGDPKDSFLGVSRQEVDQMLTRSFLPKHEIVPNDQHELLMKELYITQKSQFPLILYHYDPITRVVGAVPGDIIKITRPSPSAGEYIIYRYCTP